MQTSILMCRVPVLNWGSCQRQIRGRVGFCDKTWSVKRHLHAGRAHVQIASGRDGEKEWSRDGGS